MAPPLLTVGGRQALVRVGRRVLVSSYQDGFVHAGNLAYLSLIALFPFFIVATALATALGRGTGGGAAIAALLAAMPADVAATVEGPVQQALAARSGALLWLGALVGLWTVASLIEAVRDILHRAYRTAATRAFWMYRLGAMLLTIAAVLLLMGSVAVEVALAGAEQLTRELAPNLAPWLPLSGLARMLPMAVMFATLYGLFRTLTPGAYKAARYPKWPGAALVAAWWVVTLWALPQVLSLLFRYDLTYGSLAGVMVSLLFFYIVGLGLVMGCELNAALAAERDRDADQAHNRQDGEMA